jgi:two-component system heavy metal sensor histidine kinase CusS
MSSKSDPERAPAPRTGRPWSLAARLTAWYAGSAFALVLACTGLLYVALARSLDRDDDDSLADKVHALRAALRGRPGDGAALRHEAEAALEGRQLSKVYVRVLGADGRSVLEAPGMGEALPPEAFPAPVGPDEGPGSGTDLRSAGGRPFRALAARARGPEGAVHVIQVALDRSQEEEMLAGYRRGMALVLGVALVGCALAGYWIARRGLRPVREVTAMARRIRPATLGERLGTAGLPAELLALADTFNAMLDRLEDSFGRMARFSADIAHELRTPVNNLRGEAEVALGKPRSPEEYREALGSCLEECDRLARLIDSLLFLARAESPKTQVERERLDVGRELGAVQAFYEAAATEAGIRLSVVEPGGLFAELNRPLFQRAVGNLVANALAHTSPGGAVTLSASRDGAAVHVEVADDGCGIDPAHLPYLLDRFYRVDASRTSSTKPGLRKGDGGGVGLGLAIVKVIAELHGGGVAVTSEVGRGTRARLRFPAAGSPAAG